MYRDYHQSRSSKRQTQPPAANSRYAAESSAPQQQQQHYSQEQRRDNGYGAVRQEAFSGPDPDAVRKLYEVLERPLPSEYAQTSGEYNNGSDVRRLYEILDKPLPPEHPRQSNVSSSSGPRGYGQSAHVPSPLPDTSAPRSDSDRRHPPESNGKNENEVVEIVMMHDHGYCQ